MRARGPAVIVGASLAGATAALALRRQGWDEPIVLIGEEAALPYERPQLSKAYLAGQREARHLLVAPEQRFADDDIELVLGHPVTELHPAEHRVTVNGRERPYGVLVLCTGAAARRPGFPGAALPGVHLLRTLADADRLRAEVSPGTRVVVVGTGLVGSEVAATLNRIGADVVAVDPFPTPLHRLVPAAVGEMLADLHGDRGVRLRPGRTVREIVGGRRVEAVVLDDGERLPAQVVVAGLGAVPNVELAVSAGLEVGAGIRTDEFGRTGAADVYAAGDVVEQFVPHRGRHERVEHWKYAIQQAGAVAATVAGTPTPLDESPWFWTDQYDVHLEVAGWPDASAPTVVDGAVGRAGEPGEFLARTVVAGRVRAVTGVGRGRELRALGRRLATGVFHEETDEMRESAWILD
ncbi:NAD(P)/FAD-dependent oxidoreductase [Streptosporangium amethystogenes]|uniref:NAD(P)/FAD-dependent oxidoreductase n=1 Tax=Streptosporangium amethystogenes TaxID=2002 RepID=UPI00379F7069